MAKPRAFAEYRKDRKKKKTVVLQPEICITLKKTMPAVVKVISSALRLKMVRYPFNARGVCAGVRLNRPLLVDDIKNSSWIDRNNGWVMGSMGNG